MRDKRIIVNDVPVTLNGRSDAAIEADINNGLRYKYEARILNRHVRRLLESGEDNTTKWSDDWADPHYESVFALTPRQAINQIYNRFPEDEGFVITDIVELDESKPGI